MDERPIRIRQSICLFILPGTTHEKHDTRTKPSMTIIIFFNKRTKDNLITIIMDYVLGTVAQWRTQQVVQVGPGLP